MLFPEDRINVHKNARLTPRGRERIVRQIEAGETGSRGHAEGRRQRRRRQPADRL